LVKGSWFHESCCIISVLMQEKIIIHKEVVINLFIDS